MANIGPIALAAFAAIKTACADAVVSVTVNGVTADAIRSMRRGDGGLVAEGYIGRETQTVWAPTATIGAVKNGQRITVAGESCEVASASPDPANAMTRIDYVVREVPSGGRQT